MSNTPTDDELKKLAEECGIGWGAGLGGMNDFLSAFARAVLAKWGTPQPVVREQLTPEQGSAMSRKHPAEDLCIWSYAMGITDAEAHHGIKGVQHGTDN